VIPFFLDFFISQRVWIMTKAELVNRMAEEADITKKAASAALEAFVEAIHQSLKQKDGKIRVADLGTFGVINRKARNGVNPQTGKKMKIPAARAPRFSPAKALREAVKKAKWG
jgi:DNA-binding protein HU-beta